MSLIEKIAQEHLALIKDTDVMSDDDSMRSIFSRTMDTSDSIISKTASMPYFQRISQSTEDFHEADETADFWTVKQGKIMRVVSNVVKG